MGEGWGCVCGGVGRGYGGMLLNGRGSWVVVAVAGAEAMPRCCLGGPRGRRRGDLAAFSRRMTRGSRKSMAGCGARK